MQPNPKWQFAIGTTSRVPHLGGLHYLISDFDNDVIPSRALPYLLSGNHLIVERTPHGWHAYTDLLCNIDQFIKWNEIIGADPVWIEIGKERGYWFLAEKSQLTFPFTVERMILYIEKENK